MFNLDILKSILDERRILRRILQDRFTQEYQFTIFLLSLVFEYILISLISSSSGINKDLGIFNIISFLLNLFLLIFYTKKSYELNAQADNKDFIARYICISLPVTIRITIKIVILSNILSFISLLLMPSLFWGTKLPVLIVIFSTFLIYKRVYKVFQSMANVSMKRKGLLE